MSIEAMNWAYQQTTGRSTAKSVLVALANQADSDGKCWPSIAYIAKRVEIEPRSVMRNITYLIDNGFMERERRGGDGEGRKTNIYHMKMQRDTESLRGSNVTQSHEGQRDTKDTINGSNVTQSHQQRDTESPKQSLNNQLKINNQQCAREPTLPDFINGDSWADWLQHRKEIKKKATPLAQKKMITQLSKLHQTGHDVNECIDYSIANGWAGIFAPNKMNGKEKVVSTPASRNKAAQERLDRERAIEHRT